MALGRGDEDGDGGDDTPCLGMDVDLDAFAINAFRGVRVANAELEKEVRAAFISLHFLFLSKSLLAQLNALTATYESLRREHSSASEELRFVLKELDKREEDASFLRTERDKAMRKGEQAKERVEALKRGMRELGESYAVLRKTFGELKESYENEKKSREDAQSARLWARESLKKLEPLLENDTYLAKEARDLVTSLKEELADSRRVIDLLRDKLHHLSTVSAEAQTQVRELEDARRESTEQVKSLLEGIEKGAEERVEIAKRRMEEMEGELNDLKECRNAKITQDLRLEHLTTTLSELQEAHIRTTAALDAVRSERIELGGVNDGLIRSLAESEEKRRTETAAHDQELDAAKKAVKDAEESQKQTDLRMVALQERFDAQTMTLRLTKEQYGDIQKIQETQKITLERANSRYIELETKMHEALEKANSRYIELETKMREALDNANSRYIELEAKMHEALKEKAAEISEMKKNGKTREDE
ncbi:hypothetical protein C0992_001470 [Termitomyces sp. T32_za158]|nr:hypothetical protein C0992_001470 [Termitomyces sp. T32_za158]